MDEKKFETLLTLIIPKIISLIIDNYAYDEITAYKEFYNSKVYSLLEDENNKLWHFSPLTLFNMFCEEKLTGDFIIPEEV